MNLIYDADADQRCVVAREIYAGLPRNIVFSSIFTVTSLCKLYNALQVLKTTIHYYWI